MKVENECRVDFQYRMSPYSPTIRKTVCSNLVSTDIVNDAIKLEKHVDKKFTNPFDVLTYTVDIINISKSIVTNAFFTDKIPIGTKFIENSVVVNGVNKRGISPSTGIYIGNIKVGCKVTITFKVVVLPQCFNVNIRNYSKIEYDYVYNIEKRPIRRWIESNSVDTKNKNQVFKQLTINNTLKIPIEIESIINTKVNIKVLQIKIGHAPVQSIYSKSYLSLCDLIIIGKVEYEVVYKHNKKNKSKKIIKHELLRDVFGFSGFMPVPVGVTYLDKNKLKIKIENISSNILDEKNIFVSTNLLLYY